VPATPAQPSTFCMSRDGPPITQRTSGLVNLRCNDRTGCRCVELAGVAQRRKQIGFDIFGTAADFPYRAVSKTAVVQAIGELGRPPPSDGAPKREIGVLKEKDAHLAIALQLHHFFDDLAGMRTRTTLPGAVR
jgi:hypothetical protein